MKEWSAIIPKKEGIKMKYSEKILNTPSSFIRNILKVTNAPDVISFAGGLPNPISFPIEDLQKSIQHAIEENGGEIIPIFYDRRLFAITPIHCG